MGQAIVLIGTIPNLLMLTIDRFLPNTIFLYSRHNEYRLGKHSSVDVCHGFRNLV
ncbi:unknown protein [Microcystis aeruginosa NIES-843]|uniref:Uncharacterized protein n=1 Tax=Microcystis aeruginosa (strain NIES-843 / IAM M-2473) TaxID=449447 RepID=B0JQM4_MICAN|nr:unknown protein [Microcystis aeruginosa NIES-843]